MRRTRFQQEISGELGEYWEKSAKRELLSIYNDLQSGRITIDEYGIARNSIGRVVMSDLLEKLTYVTDKVDEEATRSAREAEVAKDLAEYRAKYTGPSKEILAELRNVHGAGTVIVDAISGEFIRL